jgi:hypothetical protein
VPAASVCTTDCISEREIFPGVFPLVGVTVTNTIPLLAVPGAAIATALNGTMPLVLETWIV